jgi:hypothetical protein
MKFLQLKDLAKTLKKSELRVYTLKIDRFFSQTFDWFSGLQHLVRIFYWLTALEMRDY